MGRVSGSATRMGVGMGVEVRKGNGCHVKVWVMEGYKRLVWQLGMGVEVRGEEASRERMGRVSETSMMVSNGSVDDGGGCSVTLE